MEFAPYPRERGRKAALNAAVGAAAVLFLGVAAVADDGMPAETLARLKAATVFLKVQAGKESATGSGFVIRTEGQTVYVATNNHVLDLRPEDLPRPGAINPVVTVVFNSGGKNEQSVRGEVLAADQRRDLAVVKVSKVGSPPAPIDLAQPAKLQETMPVYILGFPLGELLATNQGNPAITVGKGTVASLRNNDKGELATVQIDGDMTPGNSGGPVVDGQGRLVGVTAATVRNRRIGFAIPAQTLTRGLKGRLLDHHFDVRAAAPGELAVRVELGVFDPFNQLKDVSFYYLPNGKPADRKLAGLPNVKKVELERGPQLLVGNFTVYPSVRGEATVCFQAVYADAEKRTFISNSQERNFSRDDVAAPPQPEPVVQANPRPQPEAPQPPPPPPEPMVQDTPNPPPPSEPRGKTSVDLMPLLDPARDVVHGSWKIKDNSLLCDQVDDWQRIEVPYRPGEEYDFVVVFSQPRLRNGITLIMPNPKGGSFWWELGGANGRRYWLGVKNTGAHYVSPKYLEPNKAYTTVVQVRRDGITCLVNGKELIQRKTDYGDLNPAGGYKLRDDKLLGLCCADPTVFHYIRLVEVTGKGSKVP